MKRGDHVMAKKPYPTLDIISQHYSYCPETGIFTIAARTPEMYSDTEAWTAEQLCRSFNTRLSGKVAGALLNNGYLKVRFGRQQLLAHRLAFVFMGHDVPEFVDHINGDRTDNRWLNLRACKTQQENTRNRKRNSNNHSGFPGITRRPHKKNCWEASIKVDDKTIYLGKYACISDAIRARLRAEIRFDFFVGSERREKAVAKLRL